jgi:beta-glucosidase
VNHAAADPADIPVVNGDPIYPDPSQPIERRVDDLVRRMSVVEKIAQTMNRAPAIERLGVNPCDYWNECLHGVARAGPATVFPQAIGLAATWDPALVHDVADAISTEARAKHHEALRRHDFSQYHGLTMWSPNVNEFRDPRWGRGQETYGEDPLLSSRCAVAFVRGLQGDDPTYLKVVSTAKHFAVHSGPESERHTFDAKPDERDFYEYYLPMFEAAVREGHAGSVMGAYNRVYGAPACASDLLLQKILRDRWKFDGYVVSDCGAIRDIWRTHKVAPTTQQAAASALKAGCDLECGSDYRWLGSALDEGLVTESDLDRALRRTFAARFRLGEFDPPDNVAYARIPISEVCSKAHDELALRAARESIVLLKNDGLLPLSKDLKRVAVIGPNADTVIPLAASYCGWPLKPTTIAQAVRDKLGADRVTVLAGCDVAPHRASWEPIPGVFLRSGGKPGLEARYFNSVEPVGEPYIVRNETLPDFFFMFWSAAHVPGLRAASISATLRGEFVAPADGTYHFRAICDDAVNGTIGGKPLVTPTDEPVTESLEFTLTKKGQALPIDLSYCQVGGFAQFSLMWDRPDIDSVTPTVAAVRDCDAIIFVGGLSPMLEGEEGDTRPGYVGMEDGDRTQIELPANQTALLKALRATGKPLVFVNCSGSAVAMPWEAENLPAIVQAWYPGQQGGTAVADVLFGDHNPAGRLPITFYRSTDDLPAFDDYSLKNRTYLHFAGKPLWPFGHGLSYTQFEYGDATVDAQMSISINIKNAGTRDGDEVVQVYARALDSKIPRPIKQLVAFERVSVRAGQTRAVQIPFDPNRVRYWETAKGDFIVEPGRYELQIGASSSDIRATCMVDVK